MHVIYLRLFFALILLVGTGTATARMAIISSPENADAAALLTEAFSSSGMEVMERSELAAIAQEKGLTDLNPNPSEYAKVGQLLGANVLVILESIDKGSILSARLVAVQAGAIVDEQSSTWPMEDPAGWAKFLAHRFSSAAPNIPEQPGSKILLGLLGIRSATTGLTAQKIEKETTFLLGRSLMQLPGIFVLERARLRSTDWERQLATQSASRYWTSSWLLDGSVLYENSKIIFDGRLRSMNGRGSHAFQVESSDPKALSEAITKSVSALLKLGPPTTSEASATEAIEFQAEAEWALRWKQYEQAERAADASWALGNRSESMGILRAKVPAEKAADANQYTLTSDGTYGNAPKQEALDDITRSLGNLLEVPMRPGQESPALSKATADIIHQASKILQAYYYQPLPRTDKENSALRWIRAQLRDLAPFVVRGGDATFKTFDKVSLANIIEAGDKFPATFHITYGLYAPLWGDTPEQSKELFLNSRAALHSQDYRLQFRIKEQVYAERSIYTPLVTAWSIADRTLALQTQEKLLQSLSTSPDPKDRLDAAILQLRRDHHPSVSTAHDNALVGKRRESFATFQNLIWGLKDDLAQGRIDPLFFAVTLNQANIIRSSYNAELGDGLNNLYKKLLFHLLQQRWPGPPEVYGSLLQEKVLTPEERDELLALLPALQTANPSRKILLSLLQKRIPLSSSGTARPSPPNTSSIVRLKPTRVYQIGFPDNQAVISVGTGQNSSFTLAYNLAYDRTKRVHEIDAASGTQKDYILANEAFENTRYFANDSEHFFLYGGEKLYRVNKDSTAIDSRSVPMLGQYASDMWLVSRKLWAASGDTVVRIDPKTLDSELIASAQRKPGKTVLDDRKPFAVDAIFPDSQGGVWLSTANEQWIYRWSETKKDFQKIEYDQGLRGKPFDRSLYLRWVGSDNRHTRQNAPEYNLLVDERRTGQPPAINTWPPKFQFPGMASFQTKIAARAATESRLYASYYGKGDMYLRVMDDAQGKTYSIPIDLHQKPGVSTYNTMIANDAGILFYDQTVHKLLFFSKEDIDKFAETKAL